MYQTLILFPKATKFVEIVILTKSKILFLVRLLDSQASVIKFIEFDRNVYLNIFKLYYIEAMTNKNKQHTYVRVSDGVCEISGVTGYLNWKNSYRFNLYCRG